MLNHVLIAAGLLTLAQPPAPKAQPAAAAPATTATYKVVDTFKIGGDGSWDYVTVDPEAGRLYVPRSTHVMVLNAKDGSSVGDIPDTAGVHGVALAPEFHKGFTSNGRAGTVTVFDTATLKVLGTVKTGQNPDAIVYEPTTKRVWAFNGRSKDATVINAEDLSVASTVALGGKPETGVVDGAGGLFVNIEDTSEVVHIDAAKMAVLARWPLAPAEEPSGLAIDAPHHRLYAGCGNQMMAVLDSETGKVLATPPIGKGVDAAAFDPATRCALSSNGEGTLTVVSTDGEHPYQVVQTVQTAPRARTMALDPVAHRIYLPTADFEAAQGNSRPAPKPGTFRIVVVGRDSTTPERTESGR